MFSLANNDATSQYCGTNKMGLKITLIITERQQYILLVVPSTAFILEVKNNLAEDVP